MAERIHIHPVAFPAPDGGWYRVETWGEAQPDGTWTGWIGFYPTEGDAAALLTERETTQAGRDALLHWATSLIPVYLEGAFARAARLRPTR